MISNTHKPASAWTDPLHSHSPSSSPESHSRPIPRMTSPSASIHVPHDHLLQPSQLHHTSSRTSISSARRPDPHPLTSPSNLEIPMMPHVQVTPTSTPSAQERSSISFNAKPHGRKRTSSIPEDTPQLSPAPHQKGSFEFRFNDPAANAQRGFINNSIRTSKYNILTFLPVNLFEQFRRLANAYFLIIVIIQSIPAVSPFPVWTSLAPLCFILGVSATKEALEDYRRHKADNIANNRLYQVVIESTPEKDTHHTHMTREQQLAKHASLSQVDSSAVLRTVASKDITVGSILKITKDQEFPADCVLLSTSRADSTCYVNTAALDGEAVPKVRVAPPSTLMYQNARQLSYLRGSIMCEPPNSALYHFQGRLTLEQSIELNELVKVQEEQAASAGMNAEDAAKYAQWQKRKDRAKNDVDTTRVSALGDQQLLLRGSKLANTEWCYCVVAYTGVVTKMMLNRNPARFKFSRFESILNRMVLIMFIFNLLCCILLAVVYSKRDYEFVNWLDHYYPTDRDDPLIDSPALGWIKNFATQYILFSFMIPMSLYVTIELVKVGQAQFMEWDSRMSYTEEDGVTHKMQVKASSLNEELGMVDYIFSDKTGTLTCNRMELSRCSINGLLYKEIRPIDKMSQPNTPEMPGKKLSTATSTGTIGCTVHEEPLQQSPLQTAHHLPTSSMDGVRRASIELASFSKHDASPILTTTATSSQHSDHENDRDVKLMADVVRAAFSGYGDQNDAHSDPAREFLLNILVNNSVLPSIRPRPAHHKHSSTLRHKQDDHKDDIDWMFQSQSPDEIALMEALYRSGVFLMERTGNHLTIRCQIPGQAVRDIEIEIVAILEFTSTRARMSVVTRMSDGRYMLYVKGADSTVIKLVDQSTSATSQLAEKTLRHTTEFAGTGSRTLLMAGKEIPQAYAITWLQTYQDAITSLDNREHKVESAFAQLEHHCMLLGCSAVDDQLQEYVPETIELLLNAGLKVIVLTGDKLETAVTIARQSRLVQPHMHLLHIKGNTPETCTESLQTTLHHVTQIKSNYHHAKQEAEFAMAIEGACLEMCLTHCQTIFLQLFLICHTVISYRSTPMQKALAVRLVKKSLNQTCLAIGDGANDVSMIQEAHVGVGIMGKEGSHAAMSSDFVLRRFHHLTYLLFLHGRYSFYRTAMVVYFSFYKNMVFPFPQFWFSFFSLNTGQTLYIALLISAFNLFLTSLPPIVVGVMEKDVHDSFLLCNPLAYKAFKEQCVFKVTKFLKWLIRGVWHGLVFYFVAHFIFSRQDVIFPSGQIEGIWFMGILILMTLCFTVNIQMTIATKYITIYNILAAILGMIAFVLILAILSSSYWVTLAPDAYQLLQHLFETHIFWSYALLSFVICMFPILVINSLSSSFPSTMSEQLRIFSKQSHPVHRHGSELVSVVPATSETEKRRYL